MRRFAGVIQSNYFGQVFALLRGAQLTKPAVVTLRWIESLNFSAFFSGLCFPFLPRSVPVVLPNTIQGRDFGPAQLHEIQSLLRDHPQWSRYQLSRQLALHWNWRNAQGQLKDMAARTLLLKLSHRGWIDLPALRRASPTRSGRRAPRSPTGALDKSPVQGTLADLGILRIDEVSQSLAPMARSQLESCLHQYHYLGYQSRVGENLQYWIASADGRALACAVFGAAAWQCAARDRWIGWGASERAAGLSQVANNTRFLILPWVRIPHLASHILGAITRRIAADWMAKYRHPIYLLETFVDRERFRATCYRAANWFHVGATKGRGRQGPKPGLLSTSIKDIYLYELHPHCQQRLSSASQPGTKA